MTLKELQIGKSAVVDTVGGSGALRQHFLDMGLIPGAEVTLVKLAPMGDPMELRIHGYELTLRLDDAAQIGITPTEKAPAISAAPADDKMVDHPGLGEGGKYHIKKGENPLPEDRTLTFALAIVLAKLARIKRQHFGLFCASVANSNTIFIGIPVNLALFGESSIPYVLLYYAASTVFFWTVGVYSITCDITENRVKIPLRTRVRQVFSPPFLGFITGLILTMLGEATTTKLHRDRDSVGMPKLKKDAKDGGAVAGRTRKDIEQQSGKPVISPDNFKQLAAKPVSRVKKIKGSEG